MKQRFLGFTAVLLVAGIQAACNDEGGEAVIWPSSIDVALFHEGEYVDGASRLLHAAYWPSAEAGEERFAMSGSLRASRVDWISSKCDPILYWHAASDDAREATLEFYKDIPVRTEDDVSGLLDEALEPVFIETDGLPPEPTEKGPAEALWRLTIYPIYPPIADELVAQGYEDVVNAVNDFATQVEVAMPRYAVSNLTEGSKAAELFHYIEDFGDRQLRAYLERENPKCLVR